MSNLKPKIVLSRLDGANWTRKGLRPFLEYRDLGLAEATKAASAAPSAAPSRSSSQAAGRPVTPTTRHFI